MVKKADLEEVENTLLPGSAVCEDADDSWYLSMQVIQDLAATIASLEARLAIVRLENLLAGAGGRPSDTTERSV